MPTDFDLKSHFPTGLAPAGLTLELDGLNADITVRTGAAGQAEMKATPEGTTTLDDLAISYDAVAKTLSLRQPRQDASSGGISIDGNSGTVNFGVVDGGFSGRNFGIVSGMVNVRAGGSVIVNGVDVTDIVNERQGGSKDRARIEIVVPEGTNLVAKHVAGQVRAQGLNGNLEVDADMGEKVDVSGVRGRGQVSMSGGADVNLSDVSGSLVVSAVGSGDLRVEKADVQSAVLSGTGSGDRAVDGHVADLVLNTTGSGDTRVSGQVGRVSGSKVGSGDLTIAGGLGDGVSERSVSNVGTGDVSIRRTGPYTPPVQRGGQEAQL